MAKWKQKRPAWCTHPDCAFLRRALDAACVGRLPTPEPHGADSNDARLCLADVLPGGEIFDLQVNGTDLDWLRWLFDAIDGERSSWLSRRDENPGGGDDENTP